MLYYNRVHQRE